MSIPYTLIYTQCIRYFSSRLFVRLKTIFIAHLRGVKTNKINIILQHDIFLHNSTIIYNFLGISLNNNIAQFMAFYLCSLNITTMVPRKHRVAMRIRFYFHTRTCYFNIYFARTRSCNIILFYFFVSNEIILSPFLSTILFHTHYRS